MQRRNFISTSIAASAAALAPSSPLHAQTPGPRQFYELRRYNLISGPQMTKLTDAHLAGALIPALNRLGIGPVGAFQLTYGPETPATYLLLPASTADKLISLTHALAHDTEFQKAAQPFNAVSTDTPAYSRVDSALLYAFENFPTLHIPRATAAKEKRIFQMRTYESPTPQSHERKLEMFNLHEFSIFSKVGFESVFFGETLIGTRTPSLTYMLTFNDLADMDSKWHAFSSDPTWVKLKSDPRYATDTLVSNISNLILTPTPYSQI